MEETTKNGEIKPTENRRVKTSLNLLKPNLDSLSKIASERKITQTVAMDEALSDWVSKMLNTTEIDNVIEKTNGYIFERNLEVFKVALPTDKLKKFSACQTAHLYFKLRDKDDRERVFEALGLTDALKQIDEVNRVLEKASVFKGSDFKGYNEFTIANELKAEQTPLQTEYLQLKTGNDAFAKLKVQRPDIFPKLNSLAEGDTEEPFDEETMNPALATVLAVTGISKAIWNTLPDSMKRKLHDAAKTGKVELAKRLLNGVESVAEAVPLF